MAGPFDDLIPARPAARTAPAADNPFADLVPKAAAPAAAAVDPMALGEMVPRVGRDASGQMLFPSAFIEKTPNVVPDIIDNVTAFLRPGSQVVTPLRPELTDPATALMAEKAARDERLAQGAANVAAGGPVMAATPEPGVIDSLETVISTVLGTRPGEPERAPIARIIEGGGLLGDLITPDALQRGVRRGKQGAAIGMDLLGIGAPSVYGQDAERAELAAGMANLSREAERYTAPPEREAALQRIAQANSFQDVLAALTQDPGQSAAAIGDVVLESLAVGAPGLAMTAGGSALGPWGTAAGAAAGGFGTEYTQTILQAIQSAGGDPTDLETWRSALADEAFMAEAKRSAVARGIPIAAFDALTGGLAGTFLRGARGVPQVLRASAAEAGLQMGGGAAGETLAQLLDKGRITSLGEIALEGVAELPGGVVETAANVYSAPGPQTIENTPSADLRKTILDPKTPQDVRLASALELAQRGESLDPAAAPPVPAPTPAPPAPALEADPLQLGALAADAPPEAAPPAPAVEPETLEALLSDPEFAAQLDALAGGPAPAPAAASATAAPAGAGGSVSPAGAVSQFPVMTGKTAFSLGQYGASIGSVADGNRRQLMVDPAGGFFWGDWGQAIERDVGAVAVGADKDAKPAYFASSAEARAAAAKTPQNKTQPVASVPSGAVSILPESERDTAPVGSRVDGGTVPGKGRVVWEIRNVPLDKLQLPEVAPDGTIPSAGRDEDAARYAEGMRRGEKFPNARGFLLDDGRVKLADGNRRAVAARAAGLTSLPVAVATYPDEAAPIPRRAAPEAVDAALAMDEDAYIKSVNPSGKRSGPEDEIAFAAGDIDTPLGAQPAPDLSFTDKRGRKVDVFETDDGLFAQVDGQTVGLIESRDGETLNQVAKEFQGAGIGAGLARAQLLRDPMTPAGSFSDAGEKTRRAALRQLRAERAPAPEALGDAAVPAPTTTAQPAPPEPFTPGGKLFQSGKNAQALQLPDGTWRTRIRSKGQWQPWVSRDTFDASPAFGYRPTTPPGGYVDVDGKRIRLAPKDAPRPKAPAGPKKPRTLLEVLARGRGLDRDAFEAEGVDRRMLGMQAGFGYVFRKEGGMTPDELREMMVEEGYLPPDSPDRPSESDVAQALDLLFTALSGEDVFASDQGDDVAAWQASQRAEAETWQEETQAILADLDEPIPAEDMDEALAYAALAAEREFAEQEARRGADEEAQGRNRPAGEGRPDRAAPESRGPEAAESRGVRRKERPPLEQLDGGPRRSQLDQDREFDDTLEGARRNVRQLQAAFSPAAKAIRAALGPAARHVVVLNSKADLDPDVAARVDIGDRTDGFFDPVTGRAYVFADVTKTPERAVWVAMHETAGHLGLRGMAQRQARGDRAAASRALVASLDRTASNPTVQALADQIARENPDYTDTRAAEEALAELGAAVRTGNYAGIARRYGVSVPPAQRAGLRGDIARLIQSIRAFLQSLVGGDGRFTDAQVYRLLESAWRYAQTAPVGEAGSAGDVDPESRQAGPFYSALAESVATGKGAPKRADAAAWKGWLDGAQRRGEFKQAERDWLGVDAWLDGRGTTTRDELADFIRANQVQVQDVTLGGEGERNLVDAVSNELGEWLMDSGREPEDMATAGDWRRAAAEIGEEADGASAVGDDAERSRLDNLFDEAVDHARALDTGTLVGPPKFANYQLPGGENYRELLLTMPEDSTLSADMKSWLDAGGYEPRPKTPNDWAGAAENLRRIAVTKTRAGDTEGARKYSRMAEEANRRSIQRGDAFRSGHFDQPNILAHVRFNERTDADGKRVLFIEEIQSDWHQQGRRKGYQGDPLGAPLTDAENARGVELQRRETRREYLSPAEVAELADLRVRMARSAPGYAIPNAPFKGTDEWAMLAFKRMARHAVDNGFDRIAWTTGDQQNARYDLAKQVDWIDAVPNKDGTRMVVIRPKQGAQINLTVDENGIASAGNRFADSFAGKQLDEIVGKDMAEKIMATTDEHHFTGIELAIGGEGMRGFYDKILPSAVNKWAKKFGGKVGEVALEKRFDVRKVGDSWEAFYTSDPDTPIAGGSTEADARWRMKTREHVGNTHGLEITPAMREAVSQGQPLFSRRAPDDLFGQPTQAERIDAERRRRDAERDGRTGTGRTDMDAGDGDLFAGDRPEQGDLAGRVESMAGLFARTRGDIQAERAAAPVPEKISPTIPRRPDYSPALTRKADLAIDHMLKLGGGSVLADRIARDFRTEGGAALIGRRITSPAELAAMAAAYRNPSWETLRYVFVDDEGVVKGETAISARMPGSGPAFPTEIQNARDSTDRGMAWLQGKAMEAGATGIWLMHNHPSGNPEPSRADYAFTDRIASNLGLPVRGHVVLNHRTFAHFIPGATSASIELVPGVKSTDQDPLQRSRGEGMAAEIAPMIMIDGPKAAAAVGKDLVAQTPENSVTVVVISARREAQSIFSIPLETLRKPRGAGLLAHLSRRSGSSFNLAVIHESAFDKLDKGDIRKAMDAGYFMDAVIVRADGSTKALANLGQGGTYSSRLLGRRGREDRGLEIYEDERDQTDSPAFRRWFGDSKVVDANGEPLVVYHGSTDVRTKFAKGFGDDRGENPFPQSFFFTPDREIAQTYGDEVTEAFLRLENPYIARTKADFDKIETEDPEATVRAMGHDGAILHLHADGPPEFVVFSPRQIKAATGNRGTFDPNSDSILESRRPRTPDVRRLDTEPAQPNVGVIRKELDALRKDIRAFFTKSELPKNPQNSLERINAVRALAFDAMMSRARVLKAKYPNSRGLQALMDTVFTEPGSGRPVYQTLTEGVQQRYSQFSNRWANALAQNGLVNMTKAENEKLRNALLGVGAPPPAYIKKAADQLRVLMDNQATDARTAGLDFGEVTDIGYLTRLYDETRIVENDASEKAFLADAQTLFADHEFPAEVGAPRGMVYDRERLIRFVQIANQLTDPAVKAALVRMRQSLQSYRRTSDLADIRAVEAEVAGIYRRVAVGYGAQRAAAWLHGIKTPNMADGFAVVQAPGAPMLKERVLGPAADTVMAKWMITDVQEILDTYGRAMSRKIEFAQRFGPTGNRVQEYLDQMTREGVKTHDSALAAQMAATVAGTMKIPAPTELNAAASWVHAVGYVAMLDKAVVSSLAEPVAAAMRTGDARLALGPLVQVARAVRKKIGKPTKRGQEVEALAKAIGIVVNNGAEAVLMNQLGGDYALSPKPAKLLSGFFRVTLLTALTQSQRIFSTGTADAYLRSLARSVTGTARGMGDAVFGWSPAQARAELAELGIADADEFSAWLLAQGGTPDTWSLFDPGGRPTPQGQLYMAAVQRFVDQVIQNPNAGMRPQLAAAGPAGRLIYGVTAFSYSFYENLLKGGIKRIETIAKRDGWTKASQQAFVRFAVPAIALAVAQTAVSTLRELLLNPDRWEDMEDDERRRKLVELGLTRSFGLGGLDPIVQYLTGIKYGKSAAETAVGAAPGFFMQNLDGVTGLGSDRNSPNTSTTEFRAAQAVYSGLLQPTLNALLVKAGGGQSSVLRAMAAAGIIVGGDKGRNEFASMFGVTPERETELDRKFTEAKKELAALEAELEGRVSRLPKDQWADEFEKLRQEFPQLLAGSELMVYKDNAQNRRLGRAGVPMTDAEGGLRIRRTTTDATTPRDFKDVNERISDLNTIISTLREDRDISLQELTELNRESATTAFAEMGIEDRRDLSSPATIAQRQAIIDELEEFRRELKRDAVGLIEGAEK